MRVSPVVLGTILDETQARYSVAMLGEFQLVKKKTNGGNPAAPGNDEINTSVCWRRTRAARYQSDSPAIPLPPARLSGTPE
jgi:hypothetical protein